MTLIAASSCGDAASPPSSHRPATPELNRPNAFDVAPSPNGLPTSFTDHLPTYNNNQVAFDMRLIPGDETKGIKPFYVAQTEVTWKMFEYWVYGGDIENTLEHAEQRLLGLRPSDLGHGHPQTDLGMISKSQQPAIGMSWEVAQAYCRWVSEQTGKTYRLPTDNEWQYLLEQSGGIPDDREALLKKALLLDNNKEMNEPPFLHMPRPVARGEPDLLGLYDLLGNAAEWVQPMGGKRWVRGGHFLTAAKDLDTQWLAFEDQTIWNESYPQIPASDSWYIDHYYQGIRLVCAIKVDRVKSPRHVTDE